MNINDLNPNEYSVVSTPNTPLNVNNLPQGSYSVADQTQQSQPSSPLPFQNLDKPTASGVFNMLPGSQLLRDVGNSAVATYQGIKGGVQKLLGNNQGAQESFQKSAQATNEINPTKDFGSGANLSLTVAAPLTGGGTALGVVGKNAVLGAGIGAANAIAQGSQTDVGKQALLGATGGAIGAGAGEAISKMADILPNRIVKQVLPQLKKSGTVDYALDNLKLGSVDSMLEHSKNSLNSYNSQIDAILNHPDLSGVKIKPEDVMTNTLKQFPNSEYTVSDIFSKMKSQLPSEAKVFSRIENGDSLSLTEANNLRKAIDGITYKTAIDSPEVKAGKDVAAAFGNTLRGLVQNNAPATKNVFSDFSKEINLNKALSKLSDRAEKAKFINMKDLIFGGLGGMIGGAPGAIATTATEKLLASPTAKIGLAKGVKYLAPSLKKAPQVLGVIGSNIASSNSPQ